MLILKGNSTHNGGVTFPSKEGVLDLIQSSPLSINSLKYVVATTMYQS